MPTRLRLLAVVLAAALSPLAAGAEVTGEFHQTYPIAADGRVAIQNVNGNIRISTWDRNEVKVDAIKRAESKEQLDELKILVSASADSVGIRTEYPHHARNMSVEYTLAVPRGVSLDSIETVNGSVTVDGAAGRVHASSVNGGVTLARASGDVDVSTVNGRVEAAVDTPAGRHIALHTVNGAVRLLLARDAGANVTATTVNGGISNDVDLKVRSIHSGGGSKLEGTVGSGGAEVKLATVNGHITLARQ